MSESESSTQANNTINWYIEKWKSWEEKGNHQLEELRDLAVKKIVQCLETDSTSLCLTNLNLTDLPDYLPDTLQRLNISGNSLRTLPNNLPPLLEELNISDNKLETVPENFPSSLQRLIAMENLIYYLPKNLPQNLQELDVSYNSLRSLPDTMPFRSSFITLQELDLSHNDFENVPANLPNCLRKLNISHNRLGSLPENLPRSLRQLDVSDNNITILTEKLPDSLWLLNISGNMITELPENLPRLLRHFEYANNGLKTLSNNLPDSIQELNISGNRLKSLPINLPNSLQRLNTYGNYISSLSNSLPNSLQWLDLARNDFHTLPENLPESLQWLSLTDNNLYNWPENVHLPSSLEVLDISYNELITFPNKLPPLLKELHAQQNCFTRFPTNLPMCIIMVNLSNNHLTRLAPCIQGLSTNTIINVENNPLTLETIDTIHRLLNDVPNMPSIIFNMALVTEDYNEIRPLCDEITHWLGDGCIDPYWNIIIEQETGTEAFSHFLYKLRQTINYENIQFQEEISEWLRQLGEENDSKRLLREKIFLIAEEATQTCEDRVTWSLNQMKILTIAFDVELGKYDNKILELIQLARGMFRIHLLEEISRKKVQSLNFVDEIEVYLAYQVRLRDILKLPVETPDMRFWAVSWLTENDLENAVISVQMKEKEDFLDYVLIDWQPWKEVLKRWNEEDYRKLENEAKNEELFKQALEKRKIQYLNDTKMLELSIDMETQLGKQVRRNIERDIWYQFTRQFFESFKLDLEILVSSNKQN